MKKYTSEKFWELYEKLPQELKDALFSEETGNNIYETCERNDIGENLETIVDYVGQVLVGVLNPEDFQKSLEDELKLEKDTARKVAQEINRFVFYPIKPMLDDLYNVSGKTSEKQIVKPSQKVEAETTILEKPNEIVSRPNGKDSYREEVE